MINYLFSSVLNGFTNEQKEYLKNDIKNSLNITFIPSNFSNYEMNDDRFNKTITWFNDIDITFKETYLIDNRIETSEMLEYLNNSDVVYLMGGDPASQMYYINKYKLKDYIKKAKIVIGVSAGAINQASEVVYKDEKIIKYDGLGLTDISIYPHLDFNDIDFLKEVFEVSKEKKIVALPNESFIRIENENIKYIGDYYPLEDETITYPKAYYEKINHVGTVQLETERLLLRRTCLADLEEFFYIQLNPKLRKYLGPTKLGTNLLKNNKYFDENMYNELDFYRWTIVKKSDNKILGTIYLNMHDEKALTAGIDYWIREDEWSKGYVTEASECILKLAFYKLNLNRIESCGAKDNPGTWKVMEKIGLKYEGIKKQGYFYYYGGIQDLVLYGITKEEYELTKSNKKTV